MHRLLLVSTIVFGCASQGITQGASGSGDPSDAGGVPPASDAAVVSIPADGGPPPSDAGPTAADCRGVDLDAGTFAPVLVIELEPGASCASWMPAAAPPVSPAPAGAWTLLSTDGLSDIAGIQIDEVVYGNIPHAHFFASDGGATRAFGWNRDLAAMPHGFVYTATQYGPCMVCGTDLLAWPPSSGGLFVGDGYEWHGNCSYALRPQGGVYAACESSFPIDYSARGVLSLSQLDEALNVTNHVTGIRPKIVAVDRLDRILESGDAGVRWIDAHATPLSDFFSADGDGAFPLIGGGLLTADDRVIPSGSSEVQPAPDWLRGRAGNAFAVLSARAYAFTDASCDARVYSAGGEFCGTVTFAGCRASPRFGVDGTAIVPLCGGGSGLWKRLLQ